MKQFRLKLLQFAEQVCDPCCVYFLLLLLTSSQRLNGAPTLFRIIPTRIQTSRLSSCAMLRQEQRALKSSSCALVAVGVVLGLSGGLVVGVLAGVLVGVLAGVLVDGVVAGLFLLG